MAPGRKAALWTLDLLHGGFELTCLYRCLSQPKDDRLESPSNATSLEQESQRDVP
jgi:hypothetical protein